MFIFRHKYFLFAFLLFIVEVLIALYVNDKIIRPYIGDVLVVMLIYCFVRAFFRVGVWKTAIGVWLFSLIIEALQYFNFVALLGLKQNKLANVVLGNYFAWLDVLSYTAGIIIILLLEKRNSSRENLSAVSN